MDDFSDTHLDSPFCPTCGQRTMLGINPEWLLTHYSDMFGAILATLIAARRERRGCSLTELCRVVYHDHKKGGPPNGPNVIQQTISHWRASLVEKGWVIVGPQTTRNGYQLVPLEALEGII